MATAVERRGWPPSPGAGFAAWVRDELARQGKRQADLLRALGDEWERAEVSRIVSGYYKNPPPEKVEAVCKALGRPVAEALIAMGYSREALEPSLPPIAPSLMEVLNRLDPQQQEALARWAVGFAALAQDAVGAKLVEKLAPLAGQITVAAPTQPALVSAQKNRRSEGYRVRQRIPRPGERPQEGQAT